MKVRLQQWRGRLAAFGLSLAAAGLAGCHHHQQTAYAPAPPPVVAPGYGRSPVTGNVTPVSPRVGEGFFDSTDGRPVFTETGMATWYYARVHKGSDGVEYDKSAPTAAHKTLPFGTVLEVTNPSNGASVEVRINDRGPFVDGRDIDLSAAAAERINLGGVSQVVLEQV